MKIEIEQLIQRTEKVEQMFKNSKNPHHQRAGYQAEWQRTRPSEPETVPQLQANQQECQETRSRAGERLFN